MIVDKLLVKDLWRPQSPITETMAGGSYRRLIFLLSQTQSIQYTDVQGEKTHKFQGGFVLPKIAMISAERQGWQTYKWHIYFKRLAWLG